MRKTLIAGQMTLVYIIGAPQPGTSSVLIIIIIIIIILVTCIFT